jgi:hypothetical protein
MPLLSKPSSAARMSLMYITIGALILIWSCVWYVWLYMNPPPGDFPHSSFFICTGLVLTGIVLLVIGLALGRIGRAARHAELPPPEATSAVAQTDQTAAAKQPVLTANTAGVPPPNPGAPVVAAPAATPVVVAQPVAAPRR